MNSKTKIKWVGAVAATAAGLAGAYYFYGSKNAKEHRIKVSNWMKSAEKEIMSEVRKLKEGALTNENYQKIVTAVTDKYQTLKSADPEDIKVFIKNLNEAWGDIKKRVEGRSKVKKVAKVAKNVAKKASSPPKE